MGIKKFDLTGDLRSFLAQIDCWAVTESELAKLAASIVGTAHMRLKKMRAIIAGRKFGASANCFSEEFRKLAQECAAIRSVDANSTLYAIAFFHLRFENIHPLTDGNGRMGRLLMAEQIHRAFAISLETTIDTIQSYENDYRAVFAAPRSEQQYERLVLLVARIVGVEITLPTTMPYSPLPTFPETNTKFLIPKKALPNLSNAGSGHAFKQRPVAMGLKSSISST